MCPLRLLKWMGNKLLKDKLVLNGQNDPVCIPHFYANHPRPLLLLLLLPWQFHRALSSSLISQTFHSTTLSTLQNERERRKFDPDFTPVLNLMWLKLRGGREITEVGMAAVGENYKALKKLSCALCAFGIKGINAVISCCHDLEELSVKRLCGAHDGEETVGSGTTLVTSVCLKEIVNGQCLAPLMIGSKRLRYLKVIGCLGDWDDTLEKIGNLHTTLVDVHLEKIQVSNVGLVGLCLSLDTLYIVKIVEYSNVGLNLVAENYRMLKKLHGDGWRTNRIGNDGLISIAKHCINLQELALIGIYPTSSSLEAIASKCKALERLALCGLMLRSRSFALRGVIYPMWGLKLLLLVVPISLSFLSS
ncbi:F-box protein SKIP2-like [Arachis stenosperma]|uniref:F-box protein SKIP2-like n=1 Tax=Arachis stenosperma TaxID=217475 RepID=UPI0025ABA9D4|nr:F-box protein SKIP2-like [Arachis stenosperma]